MVGVVYRDSDGDGAYSVGEGLAGVTVTPARGNYFAVTSTSGGYAIPLDSGNGSIQVTFSGGPLPSSISRTVTLAGQNLKLDLETISSGGAAVFGFVPGSARRTPAGIFQADLYGPANLSVTVESSEDLSQWTMRTTVNLTGANTPFTDAQAGLQSSRFYRAVKN